jgi:hypothetical protein
MKSTCEKSSKVLAVKNMTTLKNRFKEGEVVYETINPSKKLIISHYTDRLYYCKVQEDRNRKPLVYFERDLTHDQAFIKKM